MIYPDRCPFCGTRKLVFVTFASGEGRSWLEVDGIKVSAWQYLHRYGVDLPDRAQVCMSCGALWGTINLQEAQTYVARHASPEFQAKLAALGTLPGQEPEPPLRPLGP